MTNRKANNSILFLTTLSVYLGLVLVGGSPSVFAQAALTPRFELVNEFEVEDDLDKKPDEDPFTTVADDIIRALSTRSALDWSAARSCEIEGLTFCKSDGSANCERSGIFEKDRFFGRPIVSRVENLARVFSESASSAGLGDEGSKKIGFKIVVSDAGFALNAAFTDGNGTDAGLFGDKVAADINRSEKAAAAALRRAIAKNTSVSRTDNQIFIATNLPRSSIDDPNSKSN